MARLFCIAFFCFNRMMFYALLPYCLPTDRLDRSAAPPNASSFYIKKGESRLPLLKLFMIGRIDQYGAKGAEL
jgi:hypothetical protein